MIIPACVIAGVVIVGACDMPGDIAPVGSSAFARPKSSTFTTPIRAQFDVGGLQVAVDDALLVRGFEGFGDLFGDGERLIDRNRTLRDAVGERRPLDQFHDEGMDTAGLLEAVDGGDVGVVQGREGLGFPLEPGDTLGVRGQRLGAAP